MNDKDVKRYQFLRRHFMCKDLLADGTYKPLFDNRILQRASSLDEAIDEAMTAESMKQCFERNFKDCSCGDCGCKVGA